MTATRDIDVTVSSHSTPLEFRRPCGRERSGEARIAAVLSGLITVRPVDEVICPSLLRRNLVVPSSGSKEGCAGSA